MGTLKKIVRQLIKEAVRESELSNMCLFHSQQGAKNYYMLFEKRFVDDVIDAYDVSDGWLAMEFDSFDTADVNRIKYIAESPYITGMMIASPNRSLNCINAWEVNLAAAQKGWGPTMYDIVMGDAPAGIIADRSSVSKDAKNIYDFYFDKRNDVEKHPLDWYTKKWTPNTDDDCYWGSDAKYSANIWNAKDPDNITQEEWLSDKLNYAYNKQPISNNIRDALVDNYIDVMRDLEDANILTGPPDQHWDWWHDIMVKFYDYQAD